MRQFFACFVVSIVLCTISFAGSRSNYIELGPADQLAIDQPRISINLVDPLTGKNLGPNFASSFLLDTGANTTLAVDDSIFELNAAGYRTEGEFYEKGVAGFTKFDVSAEYTFVFAGSDGVEHHLDNIRILSSTETSFCPVPGSCSFFGIVGMPVMIDRVTTMDLSAIGSGQVGENFEELFELDFLSTTFSDELPETDNRRYTVPLTPARFPAEADGPLPSWADLSFMNLTAGFEGNEVTGNFILDTGAQLSIISSKMAFDLGLDRNGNGILFDEAVGSQEIGGVGGTVDAPVMEIQELRIPTDQGVDLVFTDQVVAVVDIDPTIDGIFGMNYMTTGWLGGGEVTNDDLEALRELLEEVGLEDLFEQLAAGEGGGAYPYFEKIHFDFREHRQGNGKMIFDLTEFVSEPISPIYGHGDLDSDGDIDFDDRVAWVYETNNTYFGDSNLDGVFDSGDFVHVFQIGQFEDNIPGNSNWEAGDWNGDGDFTSSDIVLAFQEGGYDMPRKNAAQVVPEPSAIFLLGIGLCCFFIRRIVGCSVT